MVAQVDDGVVRVLAHHVKPAGLSADGCYLFAHRHIQVLQETCSTLAVGFFLYYFVAINPLVPSI